MQNEEQPIIMRISIAEIRSRGGLRRPGYVEALLAAGRADEDGVHWLIPLKRLQEVWVLYGAPGLGDELGQGCDGCGG